MIRSLHVSQYVVYALAATFAVAILCVRPAHADLAISGAGSAQQAQIKSIYAGMIPAVFKSTSALPVTVLGDHDMNSYIDRGSGQSADTNDDDTIDGIFEDAPSRITLRGSTDASDMPFTFAHEYGHYVWETFLTKADRDNYGKIYKTQLRAHRLITDYAATDVFEGFAEAFSFYIVDKNQLSRRDNLSCQFLDDVLARMNTHKST